jgi:hypothetical protein
MRRVFIAVVLTILAAPLGAHAQGKARRPKLDLRATPRMAFSPTVAFFTAELQGGDESNEDYYCPEVVWDWDDGGRSARGADCPAYEPGAQLERRFTAEHAYPRAGIYTVKVTLLRSGKPLAVASATVNVRPGAGDFSAADGE